ncbi:MAG: ATP phosphoribosyltransferase [Anaerolineales bacterium]|nr:ATP phosphoribosyltransferase [Anaerolineales bacterium]
MKDRTDIRMALPSKGRLESASLEFLKACGLNVLKPNPRQYQARIPAVPGLTVLFQRPGDIVIGVRQGSLDFGISGADLIEEKKGGEGGVVVLHDSLGFGHCSLVLAAPEEWQDVRSASDLARKAPGMPREGKPLRVATKYPVLTAQFLRANQIQPFELISSEGTLEVAPAIGFADMISDLVETGTTLRDNHLRPLADGEILRSQACLIANRASLKSRPEVLDAAQTLLEYIEAHLRAQEAYLVFANMRGKSQREIAAEIFAQTDLGGLQGPTICEVFTREGAGQGWFAVNVIVRREKIMRAVQELRAIGGSGVVVSPVTYIFEEEPARFARLREELEK